MALTITVGGTDVTSEVQVESIRCTETANAGAKVATASFKILDEGANLSPTIKDDVTIVDGATTYFKGEVATEPDAYEYSAGDIEWTIDCHDYNQLAHETVLTSYTVAAATKSDATIVDDLVTAARGETDIDSTTNVTEVVASGSMPAFSAYACSLADALDQLCEITGARWYIDFEKDLYYFATSGTTETNELSDEDPLPGNHYRYWGLKRIGDPGLANAVYVLGKVDSVSGWRTDATSVSSYGSREVAIRDQAVSTTDDRDYRGDAILTANKDPKKTYELYTSQGGWTAGNNINLTSSVFSLSDETLLCIEIETTFERGGSNPTYKLTLGDDLLTAPIAQRLTETRIERVEQHVNDVDTLTIRGWSHSMTFTANDYNTVAWTAGTLHTAGGSGDFSIVSGNTGNMAALTYIYLDIDTSTTVLQTSTNAADAVGSNKIMVATASNNADVNKYAPFKVFGGDGWGGTWVTADVIAAGVITTDEIASNTILAGNIASGAVDTDELAAGAVEADKINVGTLSAVAADMGTLTAGAINMFTGTWDSNATGFRLTAAEFASQSSGTDQVVLSASDGLLKCGAGDVVLDANGITLTAGTGSRNRIEWDVGATNIGYIGADDDGNDTDFLIFAQRAGAGGTTETNIECWSGSTGSSVHLYSDHIYLGGIGVAYTAFVEVDSELFINDDANADVTRGMTINQGTSDDHILALKSSDVAHGYTSLAETDTFGFMQKADASAGGLKITGLRDADSTNRQALLLSGFLAEDVDTTKTTAGHGIIEINAYQSSGNAIDSTVADGNVVAFRTYRGSYDTIVIFDEDGDIYYDGTTSAYDDFDDALMCAGLAQIMAGNWNALTPQLEALGIVGPPDKRGHRMVSNKKLNMLLLGAIAQLYRRG